MSQVIDPSAHHQSKFPSHPTFGFPILPKPYGVWQDGVLWNAQSVGKIQYTYDESIKTVLDIFTTSVAENADRPAVGSRTLIRRDMVEDPKDKKKYEKLTLGDYTWLSYREWATRIRNFGSGLVTFADLHPKDRVLIYAETQREWMTACLGCYHHNITVVTSYATLGADAAAFSVNQTRATVVIADAKLMPNVLKVHDKCPRLKKIVSLGSVSDEDRAKLEKGGMKVTTMDDLVSQGEAEPAPIVPPTYDDVAVIMYTSGTTGNPKGVVLTHGNALSAMTGLYTLLQGMFSNNDVYIAYLPLAHILELVAEVCMIHLGAALGYGNPHTLTNTGVKLAPGCPGDMVVLRPSIVVFAPLVLEKIYAGVQAKVAAGGWIKQWLFQRALESGLYNFDHGIIGANPFWNSLVFRGIQDMIGGRVRVIVTGSAPLDANVHKFVQAVFGCPVRQGYGATETSAASATNELCDSTAGVVGPPRVSCCVKLVDWEEGGYRFADKDNPSIGVPRGEIVIGGGLVAQGYLIDDECPDAELVEKNTTDFRTDEKGVRWFYTGDIGEVDANGCIKIIDRKKDLVKLQQGEYVALSKVEGVLKLSPYVDNALVHASSDQKFCVALICPSFAQLHPFCDQHAIPHDDREALCQHPQVLAEVLRSCREVSKGKLAAFEIPEKIALVPPSRTWTPENDLLTAAMKLKRKPIAAAHKDDLDRLYKPA